MPPSPTDDAPVTTGDPVYAYKSSLIGSPFEFRLAADALEWRKGPREGRTAYDHIRRIRLSFRPMTMQSHRFLAEIWPDNGPKLQIASTSWRSMMEQERLDGPYAAFVSELNRRVGAAGGTPLLQAGSHPLVYWPGLAVVLGLGIAVVVLIVRALQVQACGGAAFIAAFLALLIWQTGNFFRRNRPGVFRPDAVPEVVLPRRR